MTAAFVNQLDIAQPLTVHTGRDFRVAPAALLARADPMPPPPERPAGYVDKGALVSFVAGVSAQNQSDVLNSTLLAQLAADKQFNRETQVLDWYGAYTNVLGKIGWTLQGLNWENYSASSTSFTVDKVVLELAAAALTGGEAAVVAATIEAAKSASSSSGPITLFNQSTHSDSQGNFQVSVCSENDGVVAMKNMAFTFSTSDNVTDVLVFHFASAKTQFRQAAQAQSLNAAVYATVRAAIIDKLGNNAKSFIANLDI